MNTEIQQQAKALGIADAYWDIAGNHHQASEETLRFFIDELSQPKSHSTLHADRQSADFDDVFLVSAEQTQTLPIQCSDYTLYDEQHQLIDKGTNDIVTQWQCPALSAGYYTLTTKTPKEKQRYRLVVAPSTCYHPDSLDNQQLRGVMLQLYSLRSENYHNNVTANWGIGDFSDLLDSVDLAAKQGFDFIGLNPMHALYPAQPQWFSPYSPSSRIYLHWIYVSLGLIPEFIESKHHLEWFEEQRQDIEKLRQDTLVDYQKVAKIKMYALHLAFANFEKHSDKERLAKFEQFIQQGGDALALHSAFYAISERYTDSEEKQLGYHTFPADLQSVESEKVQQFIKENTDTIRFYSYLQWLIDEQLSLVRQRCQERHLALGLYGDLAIGVASGSADSWANPELYSLPASIGAPPDPLGPVGQNWELPPMHPRILKQQGFQIIIDTLRANMKYCGAIRIDHVMGLYRLWLIPYGKPNSEGAYIHYPFELLMGILAIESQRANCIVIGEDLGTVPNEVRDTLRKYRVLSYDVLYFAGKQEHSGQIRWRCPSCVQRASLGVLGTHDLPPLKAWWHCDDLPLLRQLGILSDTELKPMFDARLHDKQALLNALKMDGYLPDNYEIDALTMAMHPQLHQAIHRYVQDAQTQLFALQPENFCDLVQAFNVPGTTDEVPNWRLKLPCALSHIDMAF